MSAQSFVVAEVKAEPTVVPFAEPIVVPKVESIVESIVLPPVLPPVLPTVLPEVLPSVVPTVVPTAVPTVVPAASAAVVTTPTGATPLIALPQRSAQVDTDDDMPIARTIYLNQGGGRDRDELALVTHLKQCAIPYKVSTARGDDLGKPSVIQNATQFEKEIVTIVNRVYATLGHAQNELTYQRALEIELKQHGLACVCEWEIPITYDGRQVGNRRADMVVRLPSGARYVLELKAVQRLSSDHLRQLKFYMVHFRTRFGLLINFPRAHSYPDVEGDAHKLEFAVKMLQGHAQLGGGGGGNLSGGGHGYRSRWPRSRGRVAPAPEIHRVKIGRRGFKRFTAAHTK